jgi:hypothetical protein
MDFCQRLFEKCFAVILGNFRSLLQLFKGGTGITIPLFKGSHCGLLPRGDAKGDSAALAFAQRLVERYERLEFPQMEQMARGFRGI